MQKNLRETARNSGPDRTRPSSYVVGPHAVEELLKKSPLRIQRILFRKASANRKLHLLQNEAKAQSIHTQQVPDEVLDKMSSSHQGVIACTHEFELHSWDDFYHIIQSQNASGIYLAIYGIEDPHNLGAVIRSAACLNVRGILLAQKSTCGITATVSKVAAGNLEKVPLYRAEKLEENLQKLRSEFGFRTVGLDTKGESIKQYSKQSDRIILIPGSESAGMAPFLRKQCDDIVALPMNPECESYNVSVAVSLALYELNNP
jgi:23S rRNA (guanosine2251-2'-O)-methyltransferase